MALQILDGFSVGGTAPIDERFVKTKQQMHDMSDNLMPSDYFCMCSDDHKFYLYNKLNTVDATTGKYRVFEGGSGGDCNVVIVDLPDVEDASALLTFFNGAVNYIQDGKTLLLKFGDNVEYSGYALLTETTKDSDSGEYNGIYFTQFTGSWSTEHNFDLEDGTVTYSTSDQYYPSYNILGYPSEGTYAGFYSDLIETIDNYYIPLLDDGNEKQWIYSNRDENGVVTFYRVDGDKINFLKCAEDNFTESEYPLSSSSSNSVEVLPYPQDSEERIAFCEQMSELLAAGKFVLLRESYEDSPYVCNWYYTEPLYDFGDDEDELIGYQFITKNYEGINVRKIYINGDEDYEITPLFTWDVFADGYFDAIDDEESGETLSKKPVIGGGLIWTESEHIIADDDLEFQSDESRWIGDLDDYKFIQHSLWFWNAVLTLNYTIDGEEFTNETRDCDVSYDDNDDSFCSVGFNLDGGVNATLTLYNYKHSDPSLRGKMVLTPMDGSSLDGLENIHIKINTTTNPELIKPEFIPIDDETIKLSPDGKLQASSSGSGALTSPITTNVDVGGIKAGTTIPSGTTFESLFNQVFVEYQKPTISLSITPSTTLYEKGTTISTLTLSANATKKSEDIANIKFYQGSTLLETVTEDVASGGNFTCGTAITAFDTDTTFKASVTDSTTGSTVESSKTIKFVVPFYYGNSDTSTVSDLADFTKDVSEKGTKTYSYTASNKYLCILYPSSYGNLTSIKDNNNFENIGEFNVSTVTISEEEYKLYITKEPKTVNSFSLTFKF